MKLKKELVDELIKATKDFFETRDMNISPALMMAENELELESKAPYYVIVFIRDLAVFSQRSGKGTYEDIYKALAIFGVEVE